MADERSDATESGKPRGWQWLWSLMWVRGVLSALALVAVLSSLGGSSLGRLLAVSDAITRKWNGAILSGLSWLGQYIPFTDLIDRHEINLAVLFCVFTLPPMLAGVFLSRKYENELKKLGSMTTRRMLGMTPSVGQAVLLIVVTIIYFGSFFVTNFPPDVSATPQTVSALLNLGAGAYYLWRTREYVKTYISGLIIALAFLLTLDALFYAPVIGDWLGMLTDWLNSQG